jgi:hypothetical protein
VLPFSVTERLDLVVTARRVLITIFESQEKR